VFIDAVRHARRMRCDIDGNLWLRLGLGDPESMASSLRAPTGVLIGRIAAARALRQPLLRGLEAQPAIFLAASSRIYALYVNTQGAVGECPTPSLRRSEANPSSRKGRNGLLRPSLLAMTTVAARHCFAKDKNAGAGKSRPGAAIIRKTYAAL